VRVPTRSSNGRRQYVHETLPEDNVELPRPLERSRVFVGRARHHHTRETATEMNVAGGDEHTDRDGVVERRQYRIVTKRY